MYIVRETRLSPTLVKEYIYCPVIPWIIYNYGVASPPTDSMELGKSRETRQFYVKNRKYRASAIIDDIVYLGKEAIIVEYKMFPSKSIHRYIEQVKASALIAQEEISHVRKALLNIGEEEKHIEISEDLLKDSKRLLNKIYNTITNDEPPPKTVYPRHCRNCWYKRYCPYS